VKKFCSILVLLMTISSSAHAGVVDKVLGKVLPPAPYTTQAALEISRAQRSLERPIVGIDPSNKAKAAVELLLSNYRAMYANAGYSLDASIAKLVKDVQTAGGFGQLLMQVGENPNNAFFLTLKLAENLAELANDPKCTPYFPPKLLADLRVLYPPTPKADSHTEPAHLASPKADTSSAAQNQVSPQATWKPSFDCAKATTFSEKAICSDSLLGKLDGALSENYKHMFASDIGDGAKKDLKLTQKSWLADRNKCTTKQCLADAYKKRIDEVCEYPVISGVHPLCTSSDEVQ
jgi:uncharacterized protein YecT (DUF1311 family)